MLIRNARLTAVAQGVLRTSRETWRSSTPRPKCPLEDQTLWQGRPKNRIYSLIIDFRISSDVLPKQLPRLPWP